MKKVQIFFEDGTKRTLHERRTEEQINNSFKIGSYMSVGYGERGMRKIVRVEIQPQA